MRLYELQPLAPDQQKAQLYLHPGQLRAWDSQRRFVFMLAGTQGGKTSFGPWWLHREILRRGAGDYLAVTASYDLFKLKMLPELRTVFEAVLGIGRFWSGDKVLELREAASPQGRFWANRSDDPMWARIILRSAQSGGGLEAATAKAAWLDECGQAEFTLEDWEAVQRRLSLAQGRVLGTTTLYNLGWVRSEIYGPWRDGDADIEVVQFSSFVNPAFPRAEYDRMKRKLPDWRFAMFYDGQFARPAGLIYGCFTDEMLVDPFAIPAEWPRVVGIDFGGANTATVWLAESPDGVWYAYHESLEGEKTSREHAETALRRAEGLPELVAIGGAASENQYRWDWADAGFGVAEPRIGGVEAGIDRVTELIKTDRFRVFRGLRGLRDELGSYSRRLDEAGEPTEEIMDKRKYHRLDALRYAATEIVDGGTAYGFV